jgi:organic radical activating enzyme
MNIVSLQIGYGTEIKDNISLNIYLSGCFNNKLCDREKCHNPELWNFSYGTNYEDRFNDILQFFHRDKFLDCIVLLGGEPFDQNISQLNDLISFIYAYIGCPLYIYTGYTKKQLEENNNFHHLLTHYITNIMYGEFKEGKETKKWWYDTNTIK